MCSSIYRGADKSLPQPGRKQATSISKSSWMMDPYRSREMPSCSAIDLDEVRPSSKISSWIWSITSGVVGLRTYQHSGRKSKNINRVLIGRRVHINRHSSACSVGYFTIPLTLSPFLHIFSIWCLFFVRIPPISYLIQTSLLSTCYKEPF
jgi:hypothetical protein